MTEHTRSKIVAIEVQDEHRFAHETMKANYKATVKFRVGTAWVKIEGAEVENTSSELALLKARFVLESALECLNRAIDAIAEEGQA